MHACPYESPLTHNSYVIAFHYIDIIKWQCYSVAMLKKVQTSTRKATTFRLDHAKQAALAHLSKILRRPMNHLVNEAVTVYLEQRSLEVERDLQTTLNSLRTYRQRDPDFKKAIAGFIDAEVSLNDPIESELTQDAGSVRTEIHRLLHG